MGFIDDSLSRRAYQRFVRGAMKQPMLTREHEQALARAWQDKGDEAAKQELVTSHMRLVVATATRFRAYGLPAGDLVQEGLTGLLVAVDRFDPARDIRFSTYAIWWIRSAMQDHVLRNWSLVRTGTTAAQKRLFFGLRRLREQIEKESGQPLDQAGREEIARRLRTDAKLVEVMEVRIGGPDRSLDLPVGGPEAGRDDELDPMSRLVDERPDPEALTMARFDGATRSRWLHEAIDGLDKREQIIIRARRLEEEAKTLSELGDCLGISKERVRQLESRALDKLRAAILERDEPPGSLSPAS